jgi:ABC transporter substrate binding protein (PQQ-dependent alcohol dehydrogenase system)
MNRLSAFAFGAALVCAAPVAVAQMQPVAPRAAQPAAPLRTVTIGFLDLEGDPRYAPVRGFDRYVLKDPEHPIGGAQVSIDDSVALRRTANAEFKLERLTVKSAEEAPAALTDAIGRGIQFVLVDLPASGYKAVAAAAKGKDVLLFNVSSPEDTLRRDLCAAEFVHVYPSRAQLMDGLVQMMVFKKWRDYLVLQGQEPEDEEVTKAFLKSAQKFGARVVAHKVFEAGSDPRKRELNNPALLSAINRDWDVTFVADKNFEFVRGVPYHTVRPRPVVGSIDLEPAAWHWTWGFNGGPQVNGRFERLTKGRKMEGADWAAWLAVKMVVQSTVRTRGGDFRAQREFILKTGTFDGDKGLATSVRAWDHQVRQGVLLTAPYQVVADAPFPGFLHRVHELDSLGDDESDSPCKLNR